MMGMRQDVNRTIYSQDDTLIELTHKFNLTSHILNCAPILVKHSDEDERLVLRQEILKPYLSKETIDSFIGDLLSTTTGQRDQLYITYITYRHLFYHIWWRKEWQEFPGTNLQVNDVELFKDSKDHILFGLILEILESNTVNQQWQT